MEYRAEAVYKEEDIVGFMKAYTFKDEKLRGMAKISRLCSRAAGVILLAAAAINTYAGIKGGVSGIKDLIPQGFMLLAGVLLLWLPVDDMAGKRTWRTYEGQGASIGFEFFPDHYDEMRQGNERPRNYGDIKGIYEDDERFYLFISEQSADIIRKDSFTEGSADDFRAFITEKTGLEPVMVTQA